MSRYLREQERDAQEERSVRLKKIQNQKKANMLSEAFWNVRQSELYPNAFLINTGIPTPQDVLLNQKNNALDDDTNRQTAVAELSKISDQETAQYIVDRLAPDEISALIQSIERIKKEIRKDYPKGLGRDEFVQYVKLKSTKDFLEPKQEPANFIDEGRKKKFAEDKVKANKATFLSQLPRKDIINEGPGNTLNLSNTVEQISKNYNISTGQLLKLNEIFNKNSGTKVDKLLDISNKAKINKATLLNSLRAIPKEDMMSVISKSSMSDLEEIAPEGVDVLLEAIYPEPVEEASEKEAITVKGKLVREGAEKKVFNYTKILKIKADLINYIADDFQFSNEEKTLILRENPTVSEMKERLLEVFIMKAGEERLSKENEGGRLKRNKKRKIKGRGLTRFSLKSRVEEEDEFQLPNNRLKIDGGKLRNNNILKLKYKCNNNIHPCMKIQRVSQILSDILYDIIFII